MAKVTLVLNQPVQEVFELVPGEVREVELPINTRWLTGSAVAGAPGGAVSIAPAGTYGDPIGTLFYGTWPVGAPWKFPVSMLPGVSGDWLTKVTSVYVASDVASAKSQLTATNKKAI